MTTITTRSMALLGLFTSAFLMLFIGMAPLASAQMVTAVSAQASSQPRLCAVAWHNLYIGLRDDNDDNIARLQDFLQDKGYFSSPYRGYFGRQTMRGVMRFQEDNGINATGYFGVMSRARMMERFCNYPSPSSTVQVQSASQTSGAIGTQVTLYGSGFTGDNTVTFGYGVVVHIPSYNGTSLTFTVPTSLEPLCRFSSPACMIVTRQTTPGTYPVSVQNTNGTSNSINFTVTDGAISQTPVTIYSITPLTGPVGTTISIRGFGFTSNNTVHFAGGALGNIPITSSVAIACTTDPNCHGGINQTLLFTVPSSIGPYCPPNSMRMCAMYMQLITPGTYTLYVENDNGRSNSFTFTVTADTSSNQAPTINGVDTPSTLAMGTVGTWTIHASTPSNTTANLHYSVNWGDQNKMANSIMAPGQTNVQSSASFTHSYSQAGTYTQVFTVTDDSGRSSNVTTTVNVTPWY